MHATYHLTSAQELTSDILDAIKITFKSKPITIIVEESEDSFELSEELKAILDERLQEDESIYISAEESLSQLKANYGV